MGELLCTVWISVLWEGVSTSSSIVLHWDASLGERLIGAWQASVGGVTILGGGDTVVGVTLGGGTTLVYGTVDEVKGVTNGAGVSATRTGTYAGWVRGGVEVDCVMSCVGCAEPSVSSLA